MTTSVDKKVTALELAQPYAELALNIAKHLKGVKAATDKLATAKGGLWGSFKQALPIGAAAGHSLSNLRAGLATACEEAKIPSGSYRGYIGTIGHMFKELEEGTLTLAEAEGMSIADARKRYKKPAAVADASESESGESEGNAVTAPPSAEDMLRNEIASRIASWDETSLQLLLATLDDVESSEEEMEELSEAA